MFKYFSLNSTVLQYGNHQLPINLNVIAFKLTFKGDYDKVTFTASRFDASTVKIHEDENLLSYQTIAYIKIHTFSLFKQLVTTEKQTSNYNFVHLA